MSSALSKYYGDNDTYAKRLAGKYSYNGSKSDYDWYNNSSKGITGTPTTNVIGGMGGVGGNNVANTLESYMSDAGPLGSTNFGNTKMYTEGVVNPMTGEETYLDFDAPTIDSDTIDYDTSGDWTGKDMLGAGLGITQGVLGVANYFENKKLRKTQMAGINENIAASKEQRKNRRSFISGANSSFGAR